jgi:hypothetical protein
VINVTEGETEERYLTSSSGIPISCIVKAKVPSCPKIMLCSAAVTARSAKWKRRREREGWGGGQRVHTKNFLFEKIAVEIVPEHRVHHVQLSLQTDHQSVLPEAILTPELMLRNVLLSLDVMLHAILCRLSLPFLFLLGVVFFLSSICSSRPSVVFRGVVSVERREEWQSDGGQGEKGAAYLRWKVMDILAMRKADLTS